MKNETRYNLFIGKTIDWTYLFLEDSFEYIDEETKKVWLKGLTGFELEFHTEEEGEESLQELFDGEWYDFYLEYLKHNRPNDVSYNDRCDLVRDEKSNDYDDSFCSLGCVQDAIDYANEQEGENYEITNCIWCGRHFNEENIKSEYYEYYIEENLQLLQKLYKKYEN